MRPSFHISMQAALTACGSSLAAHSAWRGKPVPAGLRPGAKASSSPARVRDGAILEHRPLAVAYRV